MSQPEPGNKFYTVVEDDEEDSLEEHEIDEVLSHDPDSDEYEVASDGEFFDIKWNAAASRWEEVL